MLVGRHRSVTALQIPNTRPVLSCDGMPLFKPGIVNLDATLGETFHIRESAQFELKADAFNALNHTSLSGLVTDPSSSSFGQLTSATARMMQITGRFTF